MPDPFVAVTDDIYDYIDSIGEKHTMLVREVDGVMMGRIIQADGRESDAVPIASLEGKVAGPVGFAASGGRFVAPPVEPRWILLPPVVYRYLDQQFIEEFFSTGRLRLSSFHQFKNYADEERGDDHEGKNVVTGIGDNITITAGVEQGHNSLILCTSVRGDNDLMRQFGCTGFFRIVDTHMFGRAIANRISGCTDGLEGFCTYKDAHLIRKKMLPRISSEIQYDQGAAPDLERVAEVVMGLSGLEGFFSKRMKFSHQCEYRMIWNLDRDVDDVVFVDCPEAFEFCERVT